MKKLMTLALLSIGMFTTAQVDLKVEVTGLKSNKGQVIIGLYDSDKNFLKKTFKGNVAQINDKKASITFLNIPKGEYAVVIFHDANTNGKLDSNFMGIPKEDYAASNNAKGFMGPPKYVDVKFKANENKTIKIKI